MPQITSIETATNTEWLAGCRASGVSTFFHTPRWAQIWTDLPGSHVQAFCRKVTFDDGVDAVLPMCRRTRYGFLVDKLSSVEGTYGGWVSQHKLRAAHGELLSRVIMSERSVVWRENPFDSSQSALCMEGSREQFTHVIELEPGIDRIYEGTTYAHKKALRKAVREGVTVEAALTLEQWREYYGVYRDTITRWKDQHLPHASGYPWSFFEHIFRTRTENEKLWIAVHRGSIVAGILTFYWNHHVVTWHGAALKSALALRPNNLLYFEIIRDAVERGSRWFDFNPSAGLSGVAEFKEQFGATRLRCRRFERRTGIASGIVAVKRVLSCLRGRC